MQNKSTTADRRRLRAPAEARATEGNGGPEVFSKEHEQPDFERELRLLREALRQLMLEREALRAETADVTAALQAARAQSEETKARLEQHLPLLLQLRGAQAQHQASVVQVQQSVVQVDRRVSDLYQSRIWRTLTSLATFFERLTGQRKAIPAATQTPVSVAPKPAAARTPEAPSPVEPDLLFNLDEPDEGQILPFGELMIRGWALLGGSGGRVEASLGDGPWAEIPYGHARPDVALAFPDHNDAEQSGFLRRLDIRELAQGSTQFRLRLTTPDGKTKEVRRTVKLATQAESPLQREGGLSVANDQLRLRVEGPRPGMPVFRGSALVVSGWAVAQTGIEQVLVAIDNGRFEPATTGRMREDVGSQYAGFPGSSHSGYQCYYPTVQMQAGAHRVRVQALSAGGHTVEAYADFEVDNRTAYEIWADLHTATAAELEQMRRQCLGWREPRISIVTPVHRTPETFLKRCVDSVRRQAYPNWELILVDDGSADERLTALLESYAGSDPRIRLRTLRHNGGIAQATNAGLEIATGDYVGFLDHDDEISADALYHVARTLRETPELDVVYCDEDKIDAQGRRSDGFFKPEWSPDLLGSMNYVCHFLVCRRTLLDELGGLRLGFDGSQDYDLVLRLSDRTDKIKRIPHVLYHWRSHPASTAMETGQKPAASEAGRRALEDHLRRRGVRGSVEETYPCRYRVRYALPQQSEVTIVIPTGGSPKLTLAMESLIADTAYCNYRIVVVDNSQGGEVIARVKRFHGRGPKISLLDQRNTPFNFSKLCNIGAALTESPYLLFLNDDTSIVNRDWLEAMLEHGQRPEVGAVGAMLLFPDDTIQHAGVIMGTYGVAGHAFRTLPENGGPYYYHFSHVIRNYAAVTGACLLTRRTIFDRFGGFDEINLPTCFQDTDLCLKIAEAGLRVVYTPYARLYHYESASKKAITGYIELAHMQTRWANWIENDPFYNPNLSRQSDSFELDLSSI